MRRLCKNCLYWKQTVLRNQGYCARDKVYRNSLYICGQFEGRPPTFGERAGELFGYFWEKTGQPTVDAATSSRKSLEMLLFFTFMLLAFIFMTVTIYPMVKKAAITTYLNAVTDPGE
jgi:nitrate reductase NapE component